MNTPVVHEGSIQVEVQRCSTDLWSMAYIDIEPSRPAGSLPALFSKKNMLLRNVPELPMQNIDTSGNGK